MVAALLVFSATQPPGPGLDPDGMAYVGVATSLHTRGTLRVPTSDWSRPDSTSALMLWPPGYPAAIAIPMMTGAPAIQSARVVNVFAAAVTAFVVTLLVAGAVGTPAGVVAALVVFTTPAIFDVHLSVLSEPLFIAILTLALATFVYARDGLFRLGVIGAAAVMTRYVGGSVAAAAVLWTLADQRYAWRRRFWRAVAVAAIPALVLGAWIARTAMAKDRHGDMVLAIYGRWSVTIGQMRDTLAQWLAPLAPEGLMRGTVAALLGFILFILVISTMRDTASSRFRQRPAELIARIISASWVLIACYLGVACAARLLVGGTIPFDWRILSPVIVLLEIMIVVSVAHWWRAYHRPVHVLVSVLALAWIGMAASVTFNDAYAAATDGSDFAAEEWRMSPLIAWVQQNGRGHTLYSNWPPAVYFHAHRIARELPDSTDVRESLTEFGTVFRASNGVIVGFNERSPDVVAPDSIAGLLGLHPLARLQDGTVWGP